MPGPRSELAEEVRSSKPLLVAIGSKQASKASKASMASKASKASIASRASKAKSGQR